MIVWALAEGLTQIQREFLIESVTINLLRDERHKRLQLCWRGAKKNMDVCCAASCGKCGGSDCNKRPGGGDSCCAGKVRAAAKPCRVGAIALSAKPFAVLSFEIVGRCAAAHMCK